MGPRTSRSSGGCAGRVAARAPCTLEQAPGIYERTTIRRAGAFRPQLRSCRRRRRPRCHTAASCRSACEPAGPCRRRLAPGIQPASSSASVGRRHPGLEARSGRGGGRALNHVAQLPHVAWPRMAVQEAQGRRRQRMVQEAAWRMPAIDMAGQRRRACAHEGFRITTRQATADLPSYVLSRRSSRERRLPLLPSPAG